MLRVLALTVVALCAFAENSAAQNPAVLYYTIRQQTFRFLQNPAVDSARRAARRIAGLDSNLKQRQIVIDSLRRRACPMPVHIPDTTRSEPMPRARPSLGTTGSMPNAAVSCSNSYFRP
jgi:hypothetical protein